MPTQTYVRNPDVITLRGVISRQIKALAKALVGGPYISVELGVWIDKGNPKAQETFNTQEIEEDNLALVDILRLWNGSKVSKNCELDFYVYNGRDVEVELITNMYVRVRDGKITEVSTVDMEWKTIEKIVQTFEIEWPERN